MKKFKFNFIDTLIVVFLIVSILGAVKYFSFAKEREAYVPKISFVVELKSVPNDYRSLVKVGDKIRDSIKGGHLGEVSNVSFSNSVVLKENTLTGEFVESEFKDKCDVFMTITGTPTTFKEVIKFDTQEIKIGKLIYIRNKKYAGFGYIVDVKVEGE